MNHQCYRIVFNAARGILMAVMETASSQGKASGSTSAKRHHPRLRRTVLLAALGLAGGQLAAQVVADHTAPGNQQATVTQTANGTIQVNIQTPSASGVSRNVYTQFDVPKAGVILNNSRTDANTTLAGYVQANPWLAAGSARVILNEVNSSNPSQLKGYVEVAGQRAEVSSSGIAGISLEDKTTSDSKLQTTSIGTKLISTERIRIGVGNKTELQGAEVQAKEISE